MIFDKESFYSAIGRQEIKDCTKCKDLCASRSRVVIDKFTKNTVAPWDHKTLPILVIGEAPGETEDQVGLPFMGVSGRVLDTYLRQYDLIDLTYVTNIVKCRPHKNRTPTPEELSNCSPYLAKQISNLKPKVIVTLGKSAMAGLEITGTIKDPKSVDWKKPDAVSSFTLDGQDYPVIPIYHPSYYLRQKNALTEQDWELFQFNYSHKFKYINNFINEINDM
jgi:DNA polymerase